MDYEKELEQKAQRYDEAIRKAKITLDCCDSASITTKNTVYDIFPELKESEDERIRKELYDFVYITTFRPKELKKKERFLNWLEKQGEQKPTWREEDEGYMSDVIAFLEDARSCRQNALDCIEWMKQLKERLS